MNSNNRKAAPIVPIPWRRGDFVAGDVPLAKPVHYANAVRFTDHLIFLLMHPKGEKA